MSDIWRATLKTTTPQEGFEGWSETHGRAMTLYASAPLERSR